MFVSVYVQESRSEKDIESLELELQLVVNHHVGPGTAKPGL